ncbi:MAG: 3D domain-containing protein [Candidatus Sumerlaeaceae bacterium]|nr:3D domain-containing protein [Candidatus Sumerlaeaceae bacterium]
MRRYVAPYRARSVVVLILALAILPQRGAAEYRTMEVTAYCPCGECNGYTRGSWKFLKLDVWNRYVSEGRDRGARYTGRTASGGKLRTPRPGLFSRDSLEHPWKIPVRLLAFPFIGTRRLGTIAADTDYYPFGTRMYVPGWGWGVVSDRGGAIKGPDRLDILFSSHRKANAWGRRHVEVWIDR